MIMYITISVCMYVKQTPLRRDLCSFAPTIRSQLRGSLGDSASSVIGNDIYVKESTYIHTYMQYTYMQIHTYIHT